MSCVTKKLWSWGFKFPGVPCVAVASDGDIRVLIVLDLLLSLLFASVVLWGLDFIGEAEFTLQNLAMGTVAIAVLTYVVVLRE
jgi:hypothetical protein